MKALAEAIKKAAMDIYSVDVKPGLTRPDEQFGDYATNVALQLAPKLKQSSKELADKLAAEITRLDFVESATVAGPGFINIKLTDQRLLELASAQPSQALNGQEILVEFGDPNPFKAMHIGHLYSYIVGDAISGLLEAVGAKVERLSYHGDVGRHVAQAIYGLKALEQERGERGKKLEDVPTTEASSFMGIAYALGAKHYEEDESAKSKMDNINQQVYTGDNPEVNRLHQLGVELSFKQFDQLLGKLNIKTDKRYLESQTSSPGIELVEQNIGKVFKESEGAIIYKGEKVGLHTRVFVTSSGIPTYETKDLGLVVLKDRDYPQATRSIVITANEQNEYFKVMMAALAEMEPEQAAKMTHLGHGFLNLTTGKMSSRTGDIYSAIDLVADVETAARKQFSKTTPELYLGAVKYEFLRHRLGSDIVYDVEGAVSLTGDSGPYLQYAHARARSILGKAQNAARLDTRHPTLDIHERSLARKIGEFPEVVEQAAADLLPNHICTYLYELAQNFNRFYESNRVIGDRRQAIRLQLVNNYAERLKSGLGLLNIKAPEQL
ncbi:arginine--tRNA ligase [Candidatus Saccharibacteria bacterium]|nr:arginine--tRNA ligase [Candidatus Saccharibacteria bacterium]